MSWVRLDDGFAEHPKIRRAGPHGFVLYVSSLCYCARALTDGFIDRDTAQVLAPLPKIRDVIARLVELDLWEVVAGGYRIHDYLEFQPTRAKVLAERAAATSRQQSRRDKQRDKPVTDRVSHATRHAVNPPAPSLTLSLGTNAAAGSKPTRELSQQPPHDEPDGADLLPGLLATRGIHITQRGLTRTQRAEIAQLTLTHGSARLADSAYAQYQPDNPAGSIVAFLPGWRELPEPAQARLSLARCPHGTIADGRCQQCPQEAHA